ncbi:MAG: AAA family ATPase [Holosporaceae bacterium]|jgi:pilus assembly protein CpaE|nr:AAA family ATPase [Holosporaceae bacterium]
MDKTNTDLPHNLIGFVNDPVSEQVIMNVIGELGMAYSEAIQGTTSDIVEFLKNNGTPKTLIMDVSNSELPLNDVVKIKEYATPGLNIIIIGSRNDVGLFRDLMLIGVSDYLVKPLNNALLKKAIEDANFPLKAITEKSGKMIQFISSVGGAGATTAAVNIGWILANRHFKRTAIMDLDFLYGTANLLLDIKAENAYLDILESPDKIDDYFIETILKKYSQKLYYLGGLVDITRGINVDLDAFDALTKFVKKQFNYVLVDSQREIKGINKISMNRSDIFIIMVEMSIASAQNTARLLDFLTLTQAGKKFIVVANKIGLSNVGALSKESFEKVINRKINYVMPLDERTALAAANVGQPLASSSSPLADILDDVTEDILGKKDNQEIVETILNKESNIIDKAKNIFLKVLRDVPNFIKK